MKESGTVVVVQDSNHKKYGLFKQWRVLSLTGNLLLDPGETEDTSTVDGVSVTDTAAVLPGWYDVTYSDSHGLFQSPSQGVGVAPAQEVSPPSNGAVTLTPKANQTAIADVSAALAKCATDTFADNFGCPFALPQSDQDDADQVTYTISGDPATGATVSGFDSSMDTATVTGKVTVAASYTTFEGKSKGPVDVSNSYTATVLIDSESSNDGGDVEFTGTD